MAYAPAKVEVAMSNGLGDANQFKIQYLTLTLASRSQKIAQHPLHDGTYVPAKFEVAKFNGLGDAFTRTYSICPLGAKVTRNVAQHTLHRVIYAPAKFEVTTSKG